MSDFANDGDVMAALQAAEATDNGAAPAAPAPATPETGTSAPVVAETATQVESGATEAATATEDTFTHIDPNSLPEELRAFHRQLQGDYTRKMQAIATERAALDGIDPQAARQAVEFAQRLNSDPQFALTVHGHLSQQLQAQGLTPAQAQAAATQQLTEHTDEYDDGGEQEYRIPPQIERELSEFRQWRQQVEEERMQTHLANELQRAEMSIRQANPHYGDADMETIYHLAASTNGDLHAAEGMYNSLQSRLMGSYLAKKASVPAQVSPPVSTGSAQQPQKFASLEDADKAAQEFLRNALANQ